MALGCHVCIELIYICSGFAKSYMYKGLCGGEMGTLAVLAGQVKFYKIYDVFLFILFSLLWAVHIFMISPFLLQFTFHSYFTPTQVWISKLYCCWCFSNKYFFTFLSNSRVCGCMHACKSFFRNTGKRLKHWLSTAKFMTNCGQGCKKQTDFF